MATHETRDATRAAQACRQSAGTWPVVLAGVTVEPPGQQHDRAASHCGAEALDRYLHHQARQDADKRVAAHSVAVNPPSARVLGYCMPSASVLTLTGLPDELARKLPRYPQLPVTLQDRLQHAAGAGCTPIVATPPACGRSSRRRRCRPA